MSSDFSGSIGDIGLTGGLLPGLGVECARGKEEGPTNLSRGGPRPLRALALMGGVGCMIDCEGEGQGEEVTMCMSVKSCSRNRQRSTSEDSMKALSASSNDEFIALPGIARLSNRRFFASFRLAP